MAPSVVTERSTEQPGITWRYCRDSNPPFQSFLFDEEQLARQRLITGQAAAGRGNTCFFTIGGQSLVLRHYRRGGLVQRISQQHYVYTGLEHTRAVREFNILLELNRLQIPICRPYACRVVRHGLFYRASLITHRLPGQTMAESLCSAPDSRPGLALWRKVGEVIAGMHAAGVFHADLNAHNIMFDGEHSVSLIDFDRAEKRVLPSAATSSGWCLANIERLYRSLGKVADREVFDAGFAALKLQWRDTLSYSISPRS